MTVRVETLSEMLAARRRLADDITSHIRSLSEVGPQVDQMLAAIATTKAKYAAAAAVVRNTDAQGDPAFQFEQQVWATIVSEFRDLEAKATELKAAVDSVTV